MRERRPERASSPPASRGMRYVSRLDRVVSSDDRTNVHTGEAPLGPFDRKLEDSPRNLLGCATGLSLLSCPQLPRTEIVPLGCEDRVRAGRTV